MLATEQLPLDVRVEMWVTDLCEALEKDYERSYPNSSHKKEFRCQAGRKYWKINQQDVEEDGKIWSGGVHAFIDKKTGDVFKAAAWSAPAKGVRYNILTQTETVLKRAGNDGGFGGYLYR